jgi:hypothetical protein
LELLLLALQEIRRREKSGKLPGKAYDVGNEALEEEPD